MVCLCFYLAMRTKEMFIILPILFVLFEIWEMFLEKRRKSFTNGTKISVTVFVIFLVILFYYKFSAGGGVTNDINSVYYQSFHLVKLVQNLLRYSILCFDLQNGGWVYYAVSASGLIGTTVLIGGLIGAAFIAVRYKDVGLLFCYLAIGVSISMVLPMINRAHVLYLYFPAIFLGLLMADVVVRLKLRDIYIFVLMGLFLFTAGMSGNVKTRDDWIANAKYERKAWDDIQNIPAPMQGTTIYIKDLGDKDYTPFFYGDGAVCKLLYNDGSINVHILKGDECDGVEYSEPYVIWEYCNERVKEIERKENRNLLIKEVFQYPQEDGSLILGIVPNRISDPMIIYADEVKFEAVIGETFISVQIPAEYIKGKETIVLKLEDAWTLGNNYVLTLENT